MRVLVWATTFGADLWSFTRRLSAEPGVTVRVVLEDPQTFLRQPIARLYPLQAELIQRRRRHGWLRSRELRADCLIFDNHLPLRRHAECGLALWHGLGWRGPNDVSEFRVLHGQIQGLWGSGRRANSRFRWACFGPSDFRHRTTVSGFAPENCRMVGAASHDDLRVPLDRRRVADDYPFDVVGAKTVLVAPTWHYGSLFGHWGDEERILETMLDRITELGANVILRMHDSFRVAASYRKLMERIVDSRKNVVVKWKDRAPDNYVDMQVADVLITNFSSLANLFYGTGRPTIHVYPVRDADEPFAWRTRGLMGIRSRQVASARSIWKFPLEMNGGLMARSPGELWRQLETALSDPHCTKREAGAFVDEHMMGADGESCARITRELHALVGGGADA